MNRNTPILVTGATGYVGGRLIPRLLSKGLHVRAAGRRITSMACRSWAADPKVELVEVDIRDLDALTKAARGCRAAYYLVHSMVAGKNEFAETDKLGADNMVAAAAHTNLERIIYLGGLGETKHPGLSRHLASRHEVGEILQSGPVPCTVLRAAMILGSGSASFEILRYLVERLPLMITPKWVHTPTQPIAIRDVLAYLTGCLENDGVLGNTFDIGGPDVLSYHDLISIYAEEAGLPKRKVIPVPVLTPGLSARWIHLVTPVPAAIARPLTEGLSIPTVCTNDSIRRLIPFEPTPCRMAIRTALDQIIQKQVETCWAPMISDSPPEWASCGDADYAGGTILTCGYSVTLSERPQRVWELVQGIGADKGYFFANALWRLRGLIDRLAGGPGLSRPRTDAGPLLEGDTFHFWRVLTVVPDSRLALSSEMKAPGQAVLDFRLQPYGRQGTVLQIFSRFNPIGLGGLLYWYALLPVHRFIFRNMLRAIAGLCASPQARVLPLDTAPAPNCMLPDKMVEKKPPS